MWNWPARSLQSWRGNTTRSTAKAAATASSACRSPPTATSSAPSALVERTPDSVPLADVQLPPSGPGHVLIDHQASQRSTDWTGALPTVHARQPHRHAVLVVHPHPDETDVNSARFRGSWALRR